MADSEQAVTGAKHGGRRGAAGAGRRGRFPLLVVARAGVGARLLHEQRGEKHGEEEEQGRGLLASGARLSVAQAKGEGTASAG